MNERPTDHLNTKSSPTFRRIWKGARVLITGGTGFLGRHLTRRLVDLEANVTVALLDGAGPEEIAALPAGIDHRPGDVCNYEQLRQLVEAVAPEFVFHLAAVGVNDPFIAAETALRVNVQGTINVLRAIQENQVDAHPTTNSVRRVIVTGTSYEYSHPGILDPGNVYAASKVAAWAFCRMYYRAHGTPVVVARPFNVYGPGQNPRALIPSAIRAALNGENLVTTPGEQRRDFVFIDDVIEGLLAIATASGIEGENLDIGTGKATPVRELVESVYALTRSTGRPKIGALPYRRGVVWESIADDRRTKALTGWQAETSLEQGLAVTIKALAGA